MKFTTSNSLLTAATVLLAFSARASAHAISIPALGIQGTGQRSDVQRPSAASPCGKVDIAKNLDSSPATAAAADGSVTIQMKAFNPGADGSLQVAVQVDADGTGKNFVAGTVTKNGNPKPKVGDVDTIVFKLPDGTKCTGGANKNRCLVSVKSTRGFGSCTVVTQGGAGAGNDGNGNAPPAASAATIKDKNGATKTATGAKATKTGGAKKQNQNGNKNKFQIKKKVDDLCAAQKAKEQFNATKSRTATAAAPTETQFQVKQKIDTLCKAMAAKEKAAAAKKKGNRAAVVALARAVAREEEMLDDVDEDDLEVDGHEDDEE
ncbi:hypothetical protein MIND_01303600 [Mycena indigotica]|uniref:Uncharacterized protein n=1 Tax=Mycena indigotica TaxID=2126181 RepID=A0A8H6VWC6_9AGAR|nr:uncharacterized protein MIND_01303600 [Mycena indigotica]KAF7290634.1 hypothetical protein MIND_01303600 [Mycena indigotica]